MDLDILPPEIVEEIAMNLEYNDLYILSQVSKRLFELLDDPYILRRIIRKTGYQGDLRDIDIKKLRFFCNTLKDKKFIPGEAYRIDHSNPKSVTKIADDIVQVSMFNDNALLLRDDGQVYAYKDTKELLSNMHNIVQVSLGDKYALFLRADGQVYASGNNDYEQLGLGCWDYKNRAEPELIPDLNGIVQVSAGRFHSLFVRSDGRVYGCGLNIYRQVGFDDSNDRNKPELIPGLENVIRASAGSAHSLCLRKDGQVYAFGDNLDGRLGLCSRNKERNTPQLIPEVNDIVQISLGYYHSLCLSKTGEVYGFGSNMRHQLGKANKRKSRLIPEVSGIIQITADSCESLFLTTDGQVYKFNSNTGEKEVIPIPEGKSCIISNLFQVIACGYSYNVIIIH